MKAKPWWLRAFFVAVAAPPLLLGVAWVVVSLFLDMGSRGHHRVGLLVLGCISLVVGGCVLRFAFQPERPTSARGFPVQAPRDAD